MRGKYQREKNKDGPMSKGGSLKEHLANSIGEVVRETNEKAAYSEALAYHVLTHNCALPERNCNFCGLPDVSGKCDTHCVMCHGYMPCMGPFCPIEIDTSAAECLKCKTGPFCPNCMDQLGCVVCGSYYCERCAMATANTENRAGKSLVTFTLCSTDCARQASMSLRKRMKKE